MPVYFRYFILGMNFVSCNLAWEQLYFRSIYFYFLLSQSTHCCITNLNGEPGVRLLWAIL